MRHIAMLIAAPLLLAACGGTSPQDNSAEALEEAAEVSDPAAAEVLENAAENGMNPQEALQQAGNAQATTVPQPAGSASGAADAPEQQQQPANAADEHAGHNAS